MKTLSLGAVLVGAMAIHAMAYEKTAQGIVVTVGPGQTQVELAAAKPGIFRLSVAESGKPKPAKSLFLSGPESVVEWKEVKRDSLVGIKTKTGELLIDPATGSWSLRDEKGKELILAGSKIRPVDDRIVLTLLFDKVAPFLAYGSGNGKSSLVKTDGSSRVGNGVAVIPYYWATLGYGAFGVTADDDHPATWTANTKSDYIDWTFTGKTADLYLMPGKNLVEAAKHYADLTGYPAVPPEWTFGYLQSRWGWKDKADIDQTLQTFRDKKLPVDAFIFDFECYTEHPDYKLPRTGEAGFDDFDFNPVLFPKPAEQIADYRALGLRVVPIRKPRIGNAETLKMLHDKGWQRTEVAKSGNVLDTRELTFSNPETRKWYGDQLKPMIEDGVAGWWNDEGESTYTKYYYWNEAEADARAEVHPGERHWSVNRAFSPGLQRLGVAAWTGDIHSSWEDLAQTPLDLLNWSLAGMPYTTCDTGGFSGTPTPEMMTRWMEAAVYFPVMRSHSRITVMARFPWLYGAEAEAAMKKALEWRSRLIPYYYSLAHEANATGVPLMRPLAMEYPDDPTAAGMINEWLMGPGLLAAPVLTENGKRVVYLPAGKWFSLADGSAVDGGTSIDVAPALDEIPAYARAGTVLPLGPVVQDTGELPGGALELRVYGGQDATFTLAEDDGNSYAYLKGKVRRTTFVWDEEKHVLSWKRTGSYDGERTFKSMHVVLYGQAGQKTKDAVLTAAGSCSF